MQTKFQSMEFTSNIYPFTAYLPISVGIFPVRRKYLGWGLVTLQKGGDGGGALERVGKKLWAT